MASGTQQHQQQQQQQQQQPQHEHHMQNQHHHQMQFTPSHAAGLTGSTNFDQQQQQQQQHMHQHNTMSPNVTTMPVNHAQGHILSMNSHHHQQHNMGTVAGSSILPQAPSNQSVSHIQPQHQSQQQQQKSQILPLLLSPRPPSLTPNSNDQAEQPENDHEQIIDQVISLEDEFSDTSGMLANVDANAGIMISHQQQQQRQHLGDINLISSGICIPDSNQFSSSSEDLLNLLLEFDREPSNLIGLDASQQLDQDEKVGIENIRKQLMSCEVQSDQQHQNTNSMSPIVNSMNCSPQQQPRVAQQHQPRNSVHQQQVTQQQQLISQTAPVIPHHQQSRQLSTPGPSQQQLSSDQSMIHSPYSSVPMSTVPVSSSGQSYTTQQQQQQQQQQQHVSGISQSNQMSINSSPSPSWQQPQLSPYSPQAPHGNSRTPSQRQGHHPIHQQHSMQHQTTTSPQMQQLHHPLQQRSPSQSVSPPASTEPSPVVKKNPLLNAQLVNSRVVHSTTPPRFTNNQTNVLNHNPILNAKLSQSSFVANSGVNVVGSPVNPNLNPQSRFIQQTSNFNYDITPQQQQNAPQQTGHMSIYGSGDQQQSTNQIFRTTTTTSAGGAPSLNMGNTSPITGLSHQVKQEIRRKVQQPKQHQTTSLLKQLLSDDNK